MRYTPQASRERLRLRVLSILDLNQCSKPLCLYLVTNHVV